MKRTVLFYPLLLATFPVVFLASQNPEEVFVLDVLSLLSIILAATALLTLLLRSFIKDSSKVAAIISILLVTFFSAGHLHEILLPTTVAGIPIGRLRYIALAMAIGGTASIYGVLRYKGSLVLSMQYVGVVALLLVAFNVASIGLHTFSMSAPPVTSNQVLIETQHTVTGDSELPDIYHIILDGYGRADILKKTHSFDNSEFIDTLKRMGFYVAADSRANYGTTTMSLASTLNMRYLDEFAEVPRSLFKDSAVVHVARKIGYKFVRFSESGSRNKRTELIRADIEIPSLANGFLKRAFMSDFSWVLFSSTLARPLARSFLKELFMRHRAEIFNNNMKRVREIPRFHEPTFTILHSYPPHPPYIFYRNGRLRPDSEYNLQTGFKFTEPYIEQLIYLNKVVTEVIEDILAQSVVDPIIIIQGDHGPDSTRERNVHNKELQWEERSGILNAYHLPKYCSSGLYPSITPVNSFRLVFDRCLGTNFGLLEDKTWSDPMDWNVNWTFRTLRK